MADEILQRARNALNRSQQFRIPSEGSGIQKTQERIPNREFRRENANDFQSRRTEPTTTFNFSPAPDTRVETHRDQNPTQSIRTKIISNKSDEDQSTASSVSSVTFSSDVYVSAKAKESRSLNNARLAKLAATTDQSKTKLNEDKNGVSPKLKLTNENTTEVVNTKTHNSGVSEFVPSESSMISSEPSDSRSKSKSSKKSGNSTTTRIRVRSFKSPSSKKSESKSSSIKASELINSIHSLEEVSVHLENVQSPEITIASERPSRKSTKSQVKFQEDEIPEENTLSHVSSLQMSVPQTEDDDDEDNSLGKVESFMSSQVIPVSVSVSEPHTLTEVKSSSSSETVAEDISEKIESIINDLTSVHESIRSRSRTYSSSFLPDVSSSKNQEIDSNEKYDSPFIEESPPQVIISGIPEEKIPDIPAATPEAKISDPQNEKIADHSSTLREKISKQPKITPMAKDSKVYPEATKTTPTHTKIKKPSEKIRERKSKKTTRRVEFDPKEISDVPDYFNYVPKTKHNIDPDFTHQVTLNRVGDLSGFCTDLIRSVADSNERMYNYTMDAAEGMTKMYHRHRRHRNKRKNSQPEP